MTEWRGKEAMEDRSFELHCIKEGDDFTAPTNRRNRRLLARGKPPPKPGEFTDIRDADKWLKTEAWRQDQERRLEEAKRLRDPWGFWQGWDQQEVKVALHTASASAQQFAATVSHLGVYHEPEVQEVP